MKANIPKLTQNFEKVTRNYSPLLTKDQKAHLASNIQNLLVQELMYDDAYIWQEQYPLLNEIEMLSSDLEWSNSFDIDEDWQKLIDFIQQAKTEYQNE